MNEQREYERIEQKVEEKLGFYIHLVAYMLVNGLLIAINLIATPGTYWFIWPLIGWGVGLVLHGLSIFVFGGGSTLRQRMIDAEIEKAGRKPQ